MDSLLLWIDGYVIWLYRITGNPFADYFIGTFMLALMSVLIGEASVSILRRVNRRHIERLDSDLAMKHELSIESKRSGDEEGYRGLNREANEAFGKVFFNMFTLSAASLWAVFISLAWMQTRFMYVEFHLPFSGMSTGYVFTFLLLYILARITIANFKKLVIPRIKRA